MTDYLIRIEPLDDEDDWVTSRLLESSDTAPEAAKAAEPQTWVQRLSARFGLPGSKEAGD